VIIEKVGSCSTLVAEKLFANGNFEITAEIADLIYSKPVVIY
jgi:inorganic pyrophosphatase/exopolyphosphatase